MGMVFCGMKNVRMTGWRLCTVVCILFLIPSIHAGDKIIFSGSGELVDSKPESDDRRVGLSPDGFMTRTSSVGAAIEMPIMPQSNSTLSGSKRAELLMKLFDRQENWIYNTADDLASDSDVNDAFGVRNYDLDSKQSDQKRGMARYLDRSKGREIQTPDKEADHGDDHNGGSTREQTSTNRVTTFALGSFGLKEKKNLSDSSEATVTGTPVQPGALVQFDNPFDQGNNPFQSVKRSERDPEFGKSLRSLISGADPTANRIGTENSSDRQATFRDLLNGGQSTFALGAGGDPINALQTEPTRQALNPMIAPETGGIGFQPQNLGERGFGASALPSPGFARPAAFLDGLGNRPGINPSPSPTTTSFFNVQGTGVPRVQARPGALDWPSRKF